ncbi:hypothetical protein EU528_04590 [Candidatus Thorarchaeota archaeon]|nr:MAG: hypothetical protein EU528_04590 [Candidatus Thorarchaeota archaeon]
MKQTFKDEVLSGNVECRKFFSSVEKESPEQIMEFCQWIVSSFEYDSHTECIKAAFHLLAHLRDISSLQKLKELHKIWKNTYLSEYEYLLELLLNAEGGAICNCNVYQDGGFNVPPYQVDLEEIDRKFDDTNHTDILTVKCKICGTEWEVEIDYSYHYPHSHWRKK